MARGRAESRTRRSGGSLTAHLVSAFDALDPMPESICIALSGGIDSIALLDAFAAVRQLRSGLRLRAVHVHHGLHEDADSWAAHCQAACDQRSIALDVVHVTVDVAAGPGPEAAARDARYACLGGALSSGEYCATAHHADDQLETVLIQLLRGAGPDGLAAMPGLRMLGAGWLWRPLLDVERSAIEEHVLTNGLDFVRDPANEDHGIDRSYLRAVIVPLIRARWPAATRTVGRSARLFAEAGQLVAALAREDLDSCSAAGHLSRKQLAALPPARQRAVLRLAIDQAGIACPDYRQLKNAVRVLLDSSPASHPVASWPGGEIRAYRDRLYLLPPHDSVPEAEVRLTPGRIVELGGLAGRLSVETASGAGLLAACEGVQYTVRYRRGGESIKLAGASHHSALRKLFQSRGIPPFLRDILPLIYADGELAAVADIWLAEGWATTQGERGLRLVWHPCVELQ